MLDYDHLKAAQYAYINVPGEITDHRLGKEFCQRFKTFLIGQSKARDPEMWPDDEHVQVLQNLVDPHRVPDEGDDLPLAALWTLKRIGLVDLLNEPHPALVGFGGWVYVG